MTDFMLSVPLSASSAKTRPPIENSASGSTNVRSPLSVTGIFSGFFCMRVESGAALQNVDVALERDAGLACADLDVDRDVGRHVIVREPHDLRRRGALAADAAIGDPLLRRDHALLDQQRLRLFAEPVQVFDGEMVGEDDVFVGAVEPMRALALGAVPERAESRLGEDRDGARRRRRAGVSSIASGARAVRRCRGCRRR